MDKSKAIGINLKQEVDKVEYMKTKVKLAKERINQAIIREGVNNQIH